MLPPGALPVGIGTMRLQDDGAVRLLHLAFDAGVRLVDTADVYGPDPRAAGENERLVARAVGSWDGPGDEVIVATKGGLVRRGKEWIPDGRAKHLRAACEGSRRALGVEAIDLYQLHAPDPRVPFATSLRALAELLRDGIVKRVGLSNVGLEELEAASEILEVASVQVALSALDLTVLKNGVFAYCVEHGIPLLAHSPLGGHRLRGRLSSERGLARVAGRRRASVEEVALAWLRALHPLVIPLPGTTRLESLDSIVRAAHLELTEEDVRELEDEYSATRFLREKGRERDASSGEIVLFVGIPGAGKTTLARKWTERGYARLSRDEEGGTLRSLLPELERKLAGGERRIVLDSTYPRRASRFDVLEIAWRHRVPVKCVWLRTSLEDAQVNAVERMVERYGRLLGPEEIKTASRGDPNTFPPDAQFRYRRQLEPPRIEEGFSAIEVVDFVRQRRPERTGRGLFFEIDGVLRKTKSGAARPSDPDDVELLPGRRDLLERYRDEGFQLLGVSYQPEIPEEAVRACFDRTRELLGLDVDIQFCPHPPGPASCWCRKPLPGLGVLLLRKHALDPSRSLVLSASAADRGFAERLGIPWKNASDFFEK